MIFFTQDDTLNGPMISDQIYWRKSLLNTYLSIFSFNWIIMKKEFLCQVVQERRNRIFIRQQV